MSTRPEISVIMPAYNAARFVADALQSVQRQKFRDYEVVVVDDGSTDRTAERVAEVAPEARLIRQANGGPARARNTAIAQSRGRLLAFLDADDVWYPDMLATLHQYLGRHPEAGMVNAEVDRPTLVMPRHCEPEPPRPRFCEIFHQIHRVPMSATLMPRESVEEVGGFDERRELYVEDWDLWLRIAARHPIGYVPRVLGWYRTGGIMSSVAEKTYRGQQLTVEKLLPVCAQVCQRHVRDPEDCARRRRHLTHHVHGRELLRAGQLLPARQALTAALQEQPLSLRTRAMHAASFLGRDALVRLYALKDRLARWR